jgi:hypothetical protein
MKYVIVPEATAIVMRSGKPVEEPDPENPEKFRPFVVTHERWVRDAICDNVKLINNKTGIKAQDRGPFRRLQAW